MSQPLKTMDKPGNAAAPSVMARGLLEIAWKRKSMIGLGVLVGFIVGVFYYARAIPVYQSKAQILVVKKRPDTFTGIDTRNLSIEDFVATHKTLMESPTIIEGAMQRRQLASLECFAGKEEDLTESIQKSLTVSRHRSAGSNNNVLDLTFRSTNSSETAIVLNAIIESYKDYLDLTYRNISDDTLKLITQARDVLQEDLKKQDAAYRMFRQQAPLFLSRNKDGASLTQEKLSSIEAKRSALLGRKAELQSYIQAIDSGLNMGGSQEALLAMISAWSTKLEGDGGNRPADRLTLNSELYRLLQEEQKLLETRGENHPEVKALRQRIDVARNYLANPTAPWHRPAPSGTKVAVKEPVHVFRDDFVQQLNHVLVHEKKLAELYHEEFSAAKALANYEMEDEKLRRDIVVTEKLLDSIIKKLEDVNLVKSVGGYDARTIAPATIGKKIYPRGLTIFAVAALCGGLFGFGLAYLAECMDKSFHSVDEIRGQLGLPVVGQIPFLKTAKIRAEITSREAALSPILYAHHHPRSVEAESYRGVRTALYFNIHGKGHKVVQITSPNSGDGKSTMAANLAISIAQSGKKVLLIDADMRRPTIHKLFGLSSATGLSSAIVEDIDLEDLAQDVSIPGLSIVPCGPIPPNPAELLTSPRFEEFLNHVRQRFEFVIVDTPPLLAVTDPSIVAHKVDGVFLNIRFRKNARPDAERAKAVLCNLKANIIGVVVNDSESVLNTAGYGGYGYSEGYQLADDPMEVEIKEHATT